MSGLQCWDASGTLIVDLGDYNMRYMGTVGLSIAAGTTTAWPVAFGGMRPTGWLAVKQDGNGSTDFYCIPGNDAFTVQYLAVRGVTAQTIYFDVYKYDV